MIAYVDASVVVADLFVLLGGMVSGCLAVQKKTRSEEQTSDSVKRRDTPLADRFWLDWTVLGP